MVFLSTNLLVKVTLEKKGPPNFHAQGGAKQENFGMSLSVISVSC